MIKNFLKVIFYTIFIYILYIFNLEAISVSSTAKTFIGGSLASIVINQDLNFGNFTIDYSYVPTQTDSYVRFRIQAARIEIVFSQDAAAVSIDGGAHKGSFNIIGGPPSTTVNLSLIHQMIVPGAGGTILLKVRFDNGSNNGIQAMTTTLDSSGNSVEIFVGGRMFIYTQPALPGDVDGATVTTPTATGSYGGTFDITLDY